MHSVSGQSFEGTRSKPLLVELAIVTAVVLLCAHLLYGARGHPVLGPWVLTILAYVLIGVPLLLLRFRSRPVDFFSWSLRDVARGCFWFLIVSLIIYPPFLIGAYGWEKFVMGNPHAFVFKGIPDFWQLAAVQLLLIGLPEEFYFRGYLQSSLNRVLKRRWTLLGARIGWSLPLTALIFAIAHTLVFYQWWHFSIFFPGLLFGYLRERTGSIIAPTLLHASSNLIMQWFVQGFLS